MDQLDLIESQLSVVIPDEVRSFFNTLTSTEQLYFAAALVFGADARGERFTDILASIQES